ncbi:hypothetical protein F4693_000717 [Sphingomonas endophytica]|uniref:TIR domain-containing protein n=1 Tax=Sphingomonas endophytica TaxID=869719 RepID=A0A7X0MLL2_9SPHN|nr:toll/interleukin-1 receptor domain-containing protein [Sphingomonas endophytica]MBB6503762.1 hypothetical protein [Sphingomonas endophytica]
MADVYIVYSSRDPLAAAAAAHLAALLRPRWTVFWDDMIVGDFVEAIEREMPIAGCVIPIWSPAARNSESVRDELALARKLNKDMVPVRVEACNAPYAYGQLSTVELLDWNGESDHDGFKQLVRKLASVVPARAPAPRASGFADVKLPAMFLSVSSHETHLKPIEAVRALRVFNAKTVLVSAYDLLPERRHKGIVRELTRLRKQGAVVLVDSGNYEAYRRSDTTWTAASFKTALEGIPHDYAFSFDVLRPSKSPTVAVREILAAVARDAQATTKPVIPIVHAPKKRDGNYDLDHIPSMIREIADQLGPPLIAIPERELGPGLVASARTVRRIRAALDTLTFYQPIHLLGTGNPWSIAILAAAGADSFDGLEWCRVVADDVTRRLYHFQQFDFFAYQARVASSPVTAAAMDDDLVDFAGKVAFHNLDVLTRFAAELQTGAASNRLEALVRELLGRENATQLANQIPDLFA